MSILFVRGRVQTKWTEVWTILTPLPPMWTLLLNSCYQVLWSSEQPPHLSTWSVVVPLHNPGARRGEWSKMYMVYG